MYEGLNSKGYKKRANLPSKYVDSIDLQLLSYERTTEGNSFSYFLRLTGQDHYILLLKFIEVLISLLRLLIASLNNVCSRLEWGTRKYSRWTSLARSGRGRFCINGLNLSCEKMCYI